MLICVLGVNLKFQISRDPFRSRVVWQIDSTLWSQEFQLIDSCIAGHIVDTLTFPPQKKSEFPKKKALSFRNCFVKKKCSVLSDIRVDSVLGEVQNFQRKKNPNSQNKKKTGVCSYFAKKYSSLSVGHRVTNQHPTKCGGPYHAIAILRSLSLGGFRELNPGPLAPEASIMPLYQIPGTHDFQRV